MEFLTEWRILGKQQQSRGNCAFEQRGAAKSNYLDCLEQPRGLANRAARLAGHWADITEAVVDHTENIYYLSKACEHLAWLACTSDYCSNCVISAFKGLSKGYTSAANICAFSQVYL